MKIIYTTDSIHWIIEISKMDSVITNTQMVHYLMKYNDFIENHPQCILCKEKYPSIITNMNLLYVEMFRIMDIAQSKNLPCVLKNIMALLPEFDALKTILNSHILEEDFDGMIDELQKDIDLILAEGFPAFEAKILGLFAENEKEESDFRNLMEDITKCTNELKNLTTNP